MSGFDSRVSQKCSVPITPRIRAQVKFSETEKFYVVQLEHFLKKDSG